MIALLELFIVSITATIVVIAMLAFARGLYRKRIPDAGWADDMRTREQRYREFSE